MFIEDFQPIAHQLIVILNIASREFQCVDAGFFCEIYPNLWHKNALQISAYNPHNQYVINRFYLKIDIHKCMFFLFKTLL